MPFSDPTDRYSKFITLDEYGRRIREHAITSNGTVVAVVLTQGSAQAIVDAIDADQKNTLNGGDDAAGDDGTHDPRAEGSP